MQKMRANTGTVMSINIKRRTNSMKFVARMERSGIREDKWLYDVCSRIPQAPSGLQELRPE